MFFVLALLLLVFLPSPWNLVGALISLGLRVLEVAYWQRRMRARSWSRPASRTSSERSGR